MRKSPLFRRRRRPSGRLSVCGLRRDVCVRGAVNHEWNEQGEVGGGYSVQAPALVLSNCT
jgi:hypothetical protein